MIMNLLSLYLGHLLPFHFIREIKIRLIEMMHAHVAILTTTAISRALGMNSNVVERTKVSPDTPYLFLEYFVVEAGFEFSLSCTGCRNVHGCLPTTKDDIVFLWSHACRIERRVGDVGFENFEITSSDKLLIISQLQDSSGVCKLTFALLSFEDVRK